MVINNYKLTFNEEGYINGFYAVSEGQEYDYQGQMSQFPDVLNSFPEGWYTFANNEFVCDNARKEQVISDRERNVEPTEMEKLDAQVTYTAMMTDTLLEE